MEKSSSFEFQRDPLGDIWSNTDNASSKSDGTRGAELLGDFLSSGKSLGVDRDQGRLAQLPVNSQYLVFAALKTGQDKAPSTGAQKDHPAAEKVLNMDEVGWRVGTWHKQEYKKLGAERIRLGEDTVTLELKKPTSKYAIVTTLELDKTFSFHFDKANGNLNMDNIRGLKVSGMQVSKAEARADGITFWSGNQKKEFGKAASEFIKALLEPLTNPALRK